MNVQICSITVKKALMGGFMVWKSAVESSSWIFLCLAALLLGLLDYFLTLANHLLGLLDYNSTFNCSGLHENLPIQLNTHEFLRKIGMVGIYGKSHKQRPPSRCSQQQPDGGQLIKNLYSDPTDKKIGPFSGILSCFSFFPWGPHNQNQVL